MVDARPHSQSFAMPGFMDPLGELPSSAENSDSDFDEADIPENLRATLHVKQKPAAEVKPVTFEDLQKVGYTSAASLTNIKEKQGGGGGGKWGWSQGTAAQRQDDGLEDLHHKTNAGLEEATGAMLRAAAESKRKREEEAAERAAARDQRIKLEQEARDALRADNQLKRDNRKQSFQQREKRKRALGMQKSGGKDFVQDEKRQLREGGGFGFD